MDWWDALASSTAKELSAVAIVVFGVIGLFTGLIVPGRTHNREIARERQVAEEHRKAAEDNAANIKELLGQNSRLLAAVRIADKFYGDFIPPVPEHPTRGGGDVG